MGVMCEILIHKPTEGVFKPGQSVTGKVKYIIDEPTECKNVILSLIGEGNCKFERLVYKHAKYFNGSEQFVSCHMNILVNGTREIVTLPIGSYEHLFEFILPKNIPTSYKTHAKTKTKYHYQCKIAYYIRLKIETLNSKAFKKEIIVYGDVNPTTPDIPMVYELERYLFRPSSGKNHKVKLNIEITKSFSKPGENIVLKIDVINDTDRIINGIKIKLVRRLTLTSTCDRRGIFEKEIEGCTIETESISANTDAAMSTTFSTHPELYSIQHSKIIKVEYIVKAAVLLPMPHVSPSVEIPIVIGEHSSDVQIDISMFDDNIGDDYEALSNWECMI